VVLRPFVLGDELDPDPNQQRGADELQPREEKELNGKEREDDPQDDGADHAVEDAERFLLAGQVAAGERDDHRVVARQQDVDNDNLEGRNPELRRKELQVVPPVAPGFRQSPEPDVARSSSPCLCSRGSLVTVWLLRYSTDCKSLPISAGLRVTLMPH